MNRASWIYNFKKYLMINHFKVVKNTIRKVFIIREAKNQILTFTRAQTFKSKNLICHKSNSRANTTQCQKIKQKKYQLIIFKKKQKYQLSMKRIQDLRIIRHHCICAVQTNTIMTLKKIFHLINNI
jgi:hypothetical protein